MSDKPSFTKSLFAGRVEEACVFPYPHMKSEEAENVQMMLDAIHAFFARSVDSAKIDREAALPESVFAGMKELGLFGLTIPEEYGGLGLSCMGYGRVMEEIGGLDASISVTLGAHHSIGLKGLLLLGTEEQKKRYLPKLASGEMVAAFALTEPNAGSDAAGLQSRAVLQGDHYLLNGNKIWISNGSFANLFTVFAKTGAAANEQKPEITAFLVERDHGVRHGPPEHKLGIRGSATNALYFEDVKVPASNVLGEVGRGFKAAMKVLNHGRLGLAAITTGGCKRLLALAVEHATQRKAFGKAIGEFDQIKHKISSMMAEIYALESMTYLTAGMVDGKAIDFSIESALCKIYGSETLWHVANETLQIAAGLGYMQEYPYERLLRDARIALIFEGTNEILRTFAALSALQEAGQELESVGAAIKHPLQNKGLLLHFAAGKAKTWLKQEKFRQVHPLLYPQSQIFAAYVRSLSWHADAVLRKHGKTIVDRQFDHMRFADMAISLYGLAATLSRTTDAIAKKGEAGAAREIELTQAFGFVAERKLAEQAALFGKNDDAVRHKVASFAYQDKGYRL